MTTAAAEDPDALVVRGVRKRFGGVAALAGVDLRVRRGEVHGLIGQNGSGKSTLVKILTGYQSPDAGEALAWGKPLRFPVTSPKASGIAFVHQDLGLVASMSVLENLCLGSSWTGATLDPISWRKERRACSELFARFKLQFDPDAVVSHLSPAERSLLAIARAFRQLDGRAAGEHLLILDEPTAYLTSSQADEVIAALRGVAARGDSIIFISHRLDEVLRATDRVTVLRDGEAVRVFGSGEASKRDLVEAMLGRTLDQFYPDRAVQTTRREALRLDRLSGQGVRDVSFTVAWGEIVGVTGLAAMGQDEIPYLLVGAVPRRSGHVHVNGDELTQGTLREAYAAGLVLVPANRQRDGLWLTGTASENLSIARLRSYFSGGWLRVSRERTRARELLQDYGVRPVAADRKTAAFSGGNQQKIVLAKWLQDAPRIIVLHEPTQGVDAGARKDILGTIQGAARAGAAVLIFSAEYEQLAETCHRVLILRDGRIVRAVTQPEMSERRILELCHAA